jgi:2-oxo-4-hydroxy-4-carboxy-5-ureidoimidazoline decarboxylase
MPLAPKPKVGLDQLNMMEQEGFLRVAGPWFEKSPWVAQRTFGKRPFASIDHLHQKLCETMFGATREEQLKLIASHPDLAGNATRHPALTPESQREQSAAGLNNLKPDEVDRLRRMNQRYREKFGFPFVICARENKKDAILSAFPKRLEHSREDEIQTALVEIGKIARLRMLDSVTEN